MPPLPMFTGAQLESLSKVLGDTSDGLKGSEIDALLLRCQIENRWPDGTKWRRLLASFGHSQDEYRTGAHVLRFVTEALAPARWTGDPTRFEALRTKTNEVLRFSGIAIDPAGRPIVAERAHTLADAQTRARRLRSELVKRGVHPEILRYCQAEFIEEGNYFHAVLEASKGLAAQLRVKSGLMGDGNTLVNAALGRPQGGHPRVAFNSLRTPSEVSEHDGLASLFRGVFSTFRNPTAHEARVDWPVQEQDALDLLSLASYLARRLEGAVATGGSPPADSK